MSNFPTTFSEQHVPLMRTDISRRGQDALIRLDEQGLEMVSGIAEADLGEILAIASTDKVREFCPNDENRFSKPEKWLAKGRGAFLLRLLETDAIVGYSWVGVEECEELPDNPTTTAFRTTVKGTGVDFVIATIEGARAVYDASNFGLETWASNTAAVKIYPRAGAQLVATKSMELNKETGKVERIQRPTLDPAKYDFLVDGEYHRYDTRLFMSFTEL